MIVSKPHKKKARSRGSLNDFYDPKVTELLERPQTATAAVNRQHGDSKHRLTALLSNGQLQMSSKKLLKEECTSEFRDRWFLKTQDSVLPPRMESVDVFCVPKMVRPATALTRERKSAAAAAGYSGDLDQPSVTSTDRSATSFARSRAGNSTEIWETFDLKVNPRSRTVVIKNKSSSGAAAASAGVSPKKKVFERQVRALGTMISNRKTLSRVNQERPNAVSADYVLFVECLRKNVLPYAAGRLDQTGGPEASTPTRLHAPVALDKGLDDDYGIVTLKELDDMSCSSSESVAYPTDVLSIEHSAVMVLNLSHRGLGPERGICLSDALTYCPALTTVKLSNNRLSDFSAVKIVNALFQHTSCTDLDLSENDLGSLCATSLANNIKDENCQLKHLHVGHCGLTEEQAGMLGSSLVNNRSITHFSAASCNIGNHGDTSWSACWPAVLQENSTLQHLDVSGNFLKRGLAISLFSKLSINKSLTSLNASFNQLSDLEAAYCAMSIEENSTMTNLDLSSNMFGSRGCIALSHCSSRPSCGLRLLNLNGNLVSELAGSYAFQCMVDVARRVDVPLPAQSEGKKTSRDAQRAQTGEYAVDPKILHIACQPSRKSDQDLAGFNPFTPGGQYDLDMSDPFHRAIAKICLKEADGNPLAKIHHIKWLNPLFGAYEHATLQRKTLPSNVEQSAVEEVVSQLILLSRNPETIPSDARYLLNMKKQVGLNLTDTLLSFILSELKYFNFSNNSTSLLDCYTLLLCWVYEYLRDRRSILDIHQLMHHTDVLDICPLALPSEPTGKGDLKKSQLFKYISELGLNDLDSTISKEQFIKNWLERSLKLHSLPPCAEFISQANRAPYVVPATGKLSIDCSLPSVDSLESKTFNIHGFDWFVNSFALNPSSFANLITFFNRVLTARDSVLHLSCEQAEFVLALLDDTNGSTHADYVEKLLHQIHNAYDCRRFLIRNMYFHEILQLRKRLGYVFNVITGNVTGHYFLDLSDTLHRKALSLLCRYSEYERATLSAQRAEFDGSQAGDGSYFRNTSYNGSYVVISDKWCQHAPSVGKLRFDYVSVDRTASVMPKDSLLSELNRVRGRRSSTIGGATSRRSGIDLLLDIIFSPNYVKQLKRVVRKGKLPNKNARGTAIAETNKSILHGFAEMNAPKDEGGHQDDSSEESEEEIYDGDEIAEEDDFKDDAIPNTTMSEVSSHLTKSINHGSSTMRLLKLDSKRSVTLPKRAMSAFNAALLAQNMPVKKKKSILNNRIHQAYVAHAMDLWLDYSKTSWEKYKQSHSDVLRNKADAIYRDTLKDHAFHSDGARDYPAEVYESSSFQLLAKQSMFRTVSFVAKRRGAVKDSVAINKATDMLKSRHNSVDKRSTFSGSNQSQSAKSVATEDGVLESPADCSQFESMLLNLEICILYSVWLETTQVTKILESFVQRDAPLYVLTRVVAILFRVVIDIENLCSTVCTVCGPRVHLECIHRLGALNYCSSYGCGTQVELDMSCNEHIVLLQAICLLVEKNICTVVNGKYQQSLIQSPAAFDIQTNIGPKARIFPKFGCLTLQVVPARSLSFCEDAGEGGAKGSALENKFLASVRPAWR